MPEIFINLKRFEVPRSMGGLCSLEDPVAWITTVIQDTVALGLGDREDVRVVFFAAESLIPAALKELHRLGVAKKGSLGVGCQGVFRENIEPGGNFGAFTTNFPAAAAKNLGCSWSIIGHSEERRDKLGVIEAYDPALMADGQRYKKALAAVDTLINQEVLKALESDLNVLLCVGETAEERGEGDFAAQRPRIQEVLRGQLLRGLNGIDNHLNGKEIVIGYEPIWAIGPGKTPPGGDYIAFVAEFIKDTVHRELKFPIKVVYGGGLKKENAPMLGGLAAIDGGLVGLTKFTGDIGFEAEGLKEIVDEYVKGDCRETN